MPVVQEQTGCHATFAKSRVIHVGSGSRFQQRTRPVGVGAPFPHTVRPATAQTAPIRESLCSGVL